MACWLASGTCQAHVPDWAGPSCLQFPLSFCSERGGKQGHSFCPGHLPGPEGLGPLIPSLGTIQGRGLFCGRMWGGGRGGSQTPHPVVSWTQEGCEPLSCIWSRAGAGGATWSQAQLTTAPPSCDTAVHLGTPQSMHSHAQLHNSSTGM